MARQIVCFLLVLLFGFGSLVSVPSDFIATLNRLQEGSLSNHLPVNPLPQDAPKLWALLVAGSNEWYNYRHQADVCHAYQILHSHGIPDEQIVVMMYDDLAQNSENPTPGVVINHPQGQDVYHGVPHDYIGETVTPQNFLKVLKGDEAAMAGVGSGKVIKSGPNDHVFVYFADHGAPGIIAFPTDELAAEDLNDAVKSMHQNNQYAKMVIYIEACESGSMFDNLLPKNINVYATTASNPDESSYACYYDDQRNTYLGDVYSVMWMEDSDQEVLTQETLKKQFQIVKKETNTSHVMQYGDLSISNMHVSEFQGAKASANVFIPPKVPLDAVPSQDVPLEILRHKLQKSQDPVVRSFLQKQINKMTRNRVFLNQKVLEIVSFAAGGSTNQLDLVHRRLPLKNFRCYTQAREYFDQECFDLSLNPYGLRVLYALVNLCEVGLDVNVIRNAMDQACVHPPVHDII